MTGVLSLDDVNSSSNGDDSTDSQSSDSQSDSGSDKFAELRELCEQLDANFDHAKEYVEEHGNLDGLVEFAQRLTSDEELAEIMEEYRRGNDIHRIIRNYLRNDDRDFTTYTGAFYGDSDDPEPGTYNDIQQRSRESEGNLMFYRALFPAPQTQFWDSDAVCWHEFGTIGYSDGQQDSHIYVTRDFVDEYGDHTIEVEGSEKPRPPANSEIGGGSASSNAADLVVDPSDHSVDELRDELQDALESGASSNELQAVLDAEKSGKDRKTGKKAIRGARNQAESREGDMSDAAAAGEANSRADVDISPDKFIELREKGLEKEEIIELFG